MITLYGTPIVWKALKQPTVITSSTEAELFALTEASKRSDSHDAVIRWHTISFIRGPSYLVQQQVNDTPRYSRYPLSTYGFTPCRYIQRLGTARGPEGY